MEIFLVWHDDLVEAKLLIYEFKFPCNLTTEYSVTFYYEGSTLLSISCLLSDLTLSQLGVNDLLTQFQISLRELTAMYWQIFISQTLKYIIVSLSLISLPNSLQCENWLQENWEKLPGHKRCGVNVSLFEIYNWNYNSLPSHPVVPSILLRSHNLNKRIFSAISANG